MVVVGRGQGTVDGGRRVGCRDVGVCRSRKEGRARRSPLTEKH